MPAGRLGTIARTPAMLRSISALATARGQRGMATEYVILFILAGLGAILLYAKFGRTVGGKVDSAGNKIAALGQDRDGGAGAGGGSGGNGGSGGSGGAGGAAVSGASRQDRSAELLPEKIGESAGGKGKKIDTKTAVLLGIGVLAVGALMILFVARRVASATKKQKRKA
jgi:hypothetical protein